MREFHLSYDLTDSDLYDSTKTKRHIVAHLFNNSVYEILSPVGSTIVFTDDTDRDVKFWGIYFIEKMHNENQKVINFHLSSTEKINGIFQSGSNPESDDMTTATTEFNALKGYVFTNLIECLDPLYPEV